jgi:hypothetical protein
MSWKTILKNDDANRILTSLGYKLIGKDDRSSKLHVWGGVVYEKGEEILALDDKYDFPPSNAVLHDGNIQSWQMGEETNIVAGDNKEDIKKIFDIITRGARSKKIDWMYSPNTLYIIDSSEWRDAQGEDSALGAEENYAFNQEPEELSKQEIDPDSWYMAANAHNRSLNYSNVEDKITNAPQYVKTAWGEVLRWIGEQD